MNTLQYHENQELKFCYEIRSGTVMPRQNGVLEEFLRLTVTQIVAINFVLNIHAYKIE